MKDRLSVKDRQELMGAFFDSNPKMKEVLAERGDVAQVDEDSFKDFCCKKAATELVALLEDVVSRYKRENKDASRIQNVIREVEQREDCATVKEYLKVVANKGETPPKGKRMNPEVERAREILDDLERCEGMKKSWFKGLKKEEETEKVAGAVTTSSVAHSHLFKPTYGKRRKRKKKKEE